MKPLTAKENQTLDRFLIHVKQNAEWRTRILGLLDWAADAMALPSDFDAGRPYPTKLGGVMALTGRQAGALLRIESCDDSATDDFRRATFERVAKILDRRDEEELLALLVVMLAQSDE